MEYLVKLNTYYLITYIDFKLNYILIVNLKFVT